VHVVRKARYGNYKTELSYSTILLVPYYQWIKHSADSFETKYMCLVIKEKCSRNTRGGGEGRWQIIT
jgi:hypothetical protein